MISVHGKIEGRTAVNRAPSDIRMHKMRVSMTILLVPDVFSSFFITSLIALTSLTSAADKINESLALIRALPLRGML